MQEHSSKVRSADLKPHRSLFERLTALISPEPENRAELLEVLTEAQERNLIDADALAMIEGVFQVSDLSARDIMVPRAQMDVIDISKPIDEWMPEVLATAPLTASLTNFMNDTPEGIAVARAMGHPAVKLVLDVKQISQETLTFEAAVDMALPWLAHVHLNDANMQAPGEGDTDFTPIMRKLRAVGYEGLLSIEAFGFADDPAVVLPRSRAYLDGILAAV